MAIDWDNAVIGPTHQIFSEPFLYQPFKGKIFSIQGIWHHPSKRHLILEDGSADWMETKPTLSIRLSDFKMPPQQNDRVISTKEKNRYRVTDVISDGLGAAQLILMESHP